MKYRLRLLISGLLAGLTASIVSCGNNAESQLILLSSKTLSDFPSASAIEYDNGKLYVLGDDAAYLLIMDTSYRRLDTVRYDEDTAYRIDKSKKPDIESATLVRHNGTSYLYALGSLSAPLRFCLYHFALDSGERPLRIDLSSIKNGLRVIPELNVEGMALVRSNLVLANRANKTHRVNQLIVAPQDLKPASFIPEGVIDLTLESSRTIGVSGLYYVDDADMLFFTASEEDTPNATEDGEITGSYLGWITDFSKKMEAKKISPDRMIALESVDAVFAKQKVESACLQKREGREFIFHLVADNDNGESRLFKMRLRL